MPRRDSAGVDVLGSSGSPVTLPTSHGGAGVSGWLRVHDYASVAFFGVLATRSSAAQIDIKVDWSEDGTVAHPQATEAVTAGVATLSTYTLQTAVAGSDPVPLPMVSLPVRAPWVRVSVIANAGTPTAYLRAVRS